MIEIGRICLKIAGRDAGKKCVVVEVIDSKFVLIDGETRRRKSNIAHLEPLAQTLKISKGASHDKVVAAFKEIGIVVPEKKPKPKKTAPEATPAPEKKAVGKVKTADTEKLN